jgi:steroid delta-isomerase-like uncharacterized protein
MEATMGNEDIERIDGQILDAWNNHDREGLMDLFADTFVWEDWTMPEPMRSREAAGQYFDAWMTAFPDFKVNHENHVIGGDTVAADLNWSGTNTGPMSMGGQTMPPTNKTVSGRGVFFARVSNGKIVEFRTRPDIAGAMQQLGAT